MSRTHISRKRGDADPLGPAHPAATPHPDTPVNADAHAQFGHRFSQIAPTDAMTENAATIQREAEDDGEEMQLKAEGGVPARPDVAAAAAHPEERGGQRHVRVGQESLTASASFPRRRRGKDSGGQR